jgi:Zn finger protein HypA/HybF involved in hydrogenase expression
MSSPFTCIKGVGLILLALFLQPGYAAKIETLMMPGSVIEGHAKNESKCTSCHQRFSKTTQNPLCLDCHDKVAADIEKKIGFHGRSPQLGTTSCSSCHTDHKGRKANVVILERELFDHDQTDFALLGGHLGRECNSCHEPDKKWREAPDECIACHREQDVHEKKLGEQCADCHTSKRWSEQKFDHGKTDFPLKGAHEKVLCDACHPNRRYKESPTACIACHRIDDMHNGGYGGKCESCHRSEKWARVKFDHGKTEFKLRGAHDKIACNSCHKPGNEAKKLASSCISCHRTDDPHKGRNGESCQECHNDSDWGKSRFDHDKDTKFTLRGPHAKASCNACHAGGIRKDTPVRECIRCHKNEDVHKGELGRDCASCHKEDGWLARVRFDHDLTTFPLYGLHALAPCESCHTQGKFASLPSSSCNDCHQGDDEHKGALGEVCSTCHNANSWKLWRYDHEQTKFSLDGAHEGLACNACHLEAPADKTTTSCVSCHQNDDVHSGRFGRDCSRCHSTEKFNKVRFGQ